MSLILQGDPRLQAGAAARLPSMGLGQQEGVQGEGVRPSEFPAAEAPGLSGPGKRPGVTWTRRRGVPGVWSPGMSSTLTVHGRAQAGPPCLS